MEKPADPPVALPRVRFLGTGTAFNHDARASQSLLVERESGGRFLVDSGPTMMMELERARVSANSIDRVFLTHFHGDHTAGLPFLLLHLVFRHGRREPFEVVGPTGVQALTERLLDVTYPELAQHMNFELRFREFPPGESRGHDFESGVCVDAIPMVHQAASLGLRFAFDGRSLGVTGDTEWCDNLEVLASESDVLLLECTSVERSPGAHVSLEELRERRDRLDCDRIVLVHLPDAVALSVATDPLAGVTASHDGDVLLL